MASMRMLVVTDLSRSQLETDLGALSRVSVVDASLDWRALDASLRACLGAALEAEAGALSYPTASSESARLDAVLRTGLVDSPPDPELDEIVRLAAETLQVPISLITLLTGDRQWFKARWGLSVPETPRAWAFCSYTILQSDVFTVADAMEDPRFRDNPLVTAEPRMRSYAGAALRDADGYALGALCAIDRQPRIIEETQKRRLLHLASLASDRLARRLNVRANRWQRIARADGPV